MASWAGAARVETPQVARPRRRPAAPRRRPRPRPFGGVVWIVVLAVLLAGVVAVNVAVLQLNVQLDELGRERIQLRADTNAAQLAALERRRRTPGSSRRRATRLGLEPRRPGAHRTRRSWRRRSRDASGPPTAASASSSASSRSSSPARSAGRSGSRASRPRRSSGWRRASSEQTTEIPAGRGTIFDRTGEPLAIGEQATTVYADPRRVQDPRRVALAAAKALGLDAEAALPAARRPLAPLRLRQAKGRSGEGGGAREADLAGLGFYAEELRYYPQRGVAAHVLGFAGVDNDGLEGLERSLDKPLVGKPGSQTTVTDPAGRVIDVIATKPERPGDDVFLTIDHRIQANAERSCARRVKRWGAKGGDGDRARPAHRRRARDGGRARLRRQPLRARRRPTGGATAPSRTSTSPARRSRS